MTKKESFVAFFIALFPAIVFAVGMFLGYPSHLAEIQESDFRSIEVVTTVRGLHDGVMQDEGAYISYTTADGNRYECVSLEDCPETVQKIVERKRVNLERKGLDLTDCVFGVHSILSIENTVVPDSTL